MKRFERALAAEFVGTAALMAAVAAAQSVAPWMAPGHPAAQLLVVSAAAAIALWVLMTLLCRTGGGHLNPIATVAAGLGGELSSFELAPAVAIFLLVQSAGALAGAWVCNWLLGDAAASATALAVSPVAVPGLVSEGVAGAGVATILFLAPENRRIALVSLFSGLLFWFTSSSGFGNPAVTLGRVAAYGPYHLAGSDAALQAAAQIAGALVALGVSAWIRGVRHEGS